MGLDASIYQSAQPIPVNVPSPLATAEQAMRLSQLGMQQQQMQRQYQTQTAINQSLTQNTDDRGNINREGFLSQLGKLAPMAAMDFQQKFVAQDKAQAEAQAAKLDSADKMFNNLGPKFDYLHTLSEDERAKAWPNIIQQAKDQGVDVSKMDHPYEPGLYQQYYGNWQNAKPHLQNVLTQSEIAKNQAEARMVPEKLKNEMFGSRSPNAELTSQYNKDISPVRSSQLYMNQMMDAYKNQTPQGDASLVLNNFKIRNPSVPDVNSIEEMKSSQAVSDAWKNRVNEALNGGFDKATRDNLLRDGISAYRANYESYQGIKDRYQTRQNFQGVNDPTMTYEPAMESTYKNAMKLQGNLGPYVPAADRGGFMAGIGKAISKAVGASGSQNANADEKKLPPLPEGMIRVRAPNGEIKRVPIAQKGEAIAAGGSVVK
jgi:hypothetical protein